MSSTEIYWDGSKLEALIKMSGITQMELSKKLNIGKTSLNTYVRGKAQPGLTAVIQLAEFFCVPVDYFIGRTEYMDMEQFYANYAENFHSLRRAAYEKYLINGKRLDIDEGYYATWPYNLIDAIFQNDPSFEASILSPEQQNGLEAAISSLNTRSKEMIYLYYRDAVCITELSRRYKRTVDYVQGRLSAIVKELRLPARKELIQKGVPIETEGDDVEVIKKINKEDATEGEGVDLSKIKMPSGREPTIYDTVLSESTCELIEKEFGFSQLNDLLQIVKDGNLTNYFEKDASEFDEILDMVEQETGESYWESYGIEI